MEDARRTAERTFDELEQMRKRQSKDMDHLRENEARAELRRQLNEAEGRVLKKSDKPAEKKVSARPARAGDVVELISMGVKAQVISVSADGGLQLQAGIMKVSANQDEVYLLENESVKKPKLSVSGNTQLRTQSTGSELDLRGMMTDEAIPVLERYLDSAVMSRLEKVTIIHGKGTGALRAAVHQNLKMNKAVKSFRLGLFGEGENGVTVVELK